MSNTSVQTAPTPAAPRDDVTPVAATSRSPGVIMNFLKPVASLKLTVVLFVLSLLLVFFGTMAQIDNGIGTVMKDYFRWWWVWVPWKLLLQFGQVFFGLPHEWTVSGAFPFPAGWTLGTLLLINLVAAHLTRFKVSWKRSGILLTHAGLIVLMLGELGTGLFAVEARMPIGEGETALFTDVSDKVELALTTPNDKDDSKEDMVVIPDRRVRKAGSRISDERLPVDVEVVEFWRNSSLVDVTPRQKEVPNKRKALDGREYGVSPVSEESGVDSEARSDMASAKVVFYKKGTDEKVKELFLSFWYYPNAVNRLLHFPPQTVTVDGKTYEVELRPKREYKDYTIKLKQFTHEKFQGTGTAKNFQSLIDFTGADGQRREVKIYMNNPMRYNGETFYQSGYFPDNSGTILQVVRNPAWLMPYLSCTMVTLGLLIHFGLNLATFLQRRASS
jgi:hypothetical protein